MKNRKHASVFTGIAGFDIAALKAGFDNVFYCEKDPFCQKTLKHYFPDAISYTDIKETDFSIHRGAIDILSGGFPCQDISVSGIGAGIFGKKSGLWSEFYRAIKEILPGCILIENSPNLLKKGFEKVLYDLSQIGYNAEWEIISASEVGMDHIRKRLWILAYPDVSGRPGILHYIKRSLVEKNRKTNPLDTQRSPFLRFAERYGEPAVFGVYDGLSKRMDTVKWLGAFGNAVVPAIPLLIFNTLKEYDIL